MRLFLSLDFPHILKLRLTKVLKVERHTYPTLLIRYRSVSQSHGGNTGQSQRFCSIFHFLLSDFMCRVSLSTSSLQVERKI